VILIISNVTLSQSKMIHGIVVDSDNKTPLPLANIQVINNNFGTSTNFAGEFSIAAPNLPLVFKISYVGYSPEVVSISEDDTSTILHIYLKQKPIQLSEVEIKAQDTVAINLVKKLFNKLENEQDYRYGAKAFYRQYGLGDTTYTEIIEMFFNLLAGNNGIINKVIEQGRYAMARRTANDTTPLFSVTNLSDLSTKYFVLYQENDSFLSFLPFVKKTSVYRPIRKDIEELYYFKLVGSYETDGKNIAIISFVPKPGVDKPAFSGSMYIDLKNLTLISIKETLDDPRINFFPSEFRGYYRGNYVLIYKAGFDIDKQGKNKLSFLETKLTFKEYNHTNKNYERLWTFRSLLKVFEYYDEKYFNDKRAQNEQSDIANVKNIRYNHKFWQKYSFIINEIPIEDNIRTSFISRGFYGNLFPGGIQVKGY